VALTRNLHGIDIAVRTVIGLALVYVGFMDTGLIDNPVARGLLGAFGVLNLVAASLRHCPLYHLAGFSTCRPRA
jgi:hypothetical protein